MPSKSQVVEMLRNAAELKKSVFTGADDEKTRMLAKLLQTWHQAADLELQYLRMREDGEVRKIRFFETSAKDSITLEDAERVGAIGKICAEIEERFAAH